MQLFVRLQTQWRISAAGQRTGLDYAAIQPVCDVMDLDYTAELFTDLQFLEITLINESLRNGHRRGKLPTKS